MATAFRGTRHPVLTALFGFLISVLVIALVAGGLSLWTVQRSFPQLSGELDVSGLEKPVKVYRDDFGVPQIVAETAHDLMLAQGYVHAQDRFWEMDFRRHVTSGRLSELFGESQIGTDTFVRTLGWRKVAEEEVKKLDKKSLAYYQAYADGVNAYIANRSGADLSLEYVVLGMQNPGYAPEPWTPADSVAWLKAMAWDLRSNLEDEIDRALMLEKLTPAEIAVLYPPYPYDENPTITSTGASPAAVFSSPAPGTTSATSAVATAASPSGENYGDAGGALESLKKSLKGMPALLGPAGGDIGSNSWVVSGALTKSGKPLLANDPHLGPVMPSVWYQMGLHCKKVSDACPFDVAGFTFSGLPGVVIGHNQKISWGFTNLGPDVADLYLEKVTDDNYEIDGKQKPLKVRKETIKVAGGDNVTISIRSTERGPLVGGLTDELSSTAKKYPEKSGVPKGNYELSLQWTALTPGTTPASIFALNSATNWDEFRHAAELFEVPAQNLIYADTEGNIGYQAPGSIPVRKNGNGTLPLAGWTSKNGWSGSVPFDELPMEFNPVRGYIVTANNAVAGPKYAHLLTADWDAGYRAARITTLITEQIKSGKPFTLASMSKIQADNFNSIAARLVPYLVALDPKGNALTGRNLLAEWNGSDDADSPASAYFNVVWRTLLTQVFEPKLPKAAPPQGGAQWFQVVGSLLDSPESAWWHDKKGVVTDRDAALIKAMETAWDEAVELMGSDSDNWSWGKLHTLTIRNASFGESGIGPIEQLFNRGPFELGGGSSVVNATGWDPVIGYEVDWVPSMRQVVDLADFDDSTWINLTGASGHAYHPNYVDQTELWQHHETIPWAFTLKAVAKSARHVLTLSPPSST